LSFVKVLVDFSVRLTFDFYLCRRLCFGSVCMLVCVSKSRITAKIVSWFHWNLVLWLGLPVGRKD